MKKQEPKKDMKKEKEKMAMKEKEMPKKNKK